MGRDTRPAPLPPRMQYFNPRAPHGARRYGIVQWTYWSRFQSTRPAWGATRAAQRDGQRARFQSTRPAWGATRVFSLELLPRFISIHAPRMGRDPLEYRHIRRPRHFNPRAPHGARPVSRLNAAASARFQSTRPAWGATTLAATLAAGLRDFNPRAPHGARPNNSILLLVGIFISIHAPRMGRDAGCRLRSRLACRFQSTRPAWGATGTYFVDFTGTLEFQSTRPAWGATIQIPRVYYRDYISIHAPRMGRDFFANKQRAARALFQSTRPAWGATR